MSHILLFSGVFSIKDGGCSFKRYSTATCRSVDMDGWKSMMPEMDENRQSVVMLIQVEISHQQSGARYCFGQQNRAKKSHSIECEDQCSEVLLQSVKQQSTHSNFCCKMKRQSSNKMNQTESSMHEIQLQPLTSTEDILV